MAWRERSRLRSRLPAATTERFGTDAKALQVGFAVDAGVRAAALAAAGATADLAAVDAWLKLVGAAPEPAPAAGSGRVPPGGRPDRVAAVPGGLAIKLHPCCYALQRPIAAVRAAVEQAGSLVPEAVSAITFSAPEGACAR